MKTNWIAIGAALGGLAVALGAVGAHALKDRLEGSGLENWKTAALYHGLHALALIGVGLFAERRGRGAPAGWCFLLGVIGFSGSLYAHALGGPHALVYVTPVGGVLLIAGWIAWTVSALRSGGSER